MVAALPTQSGALPAKSPKTRPMRPKEYTQVVDLQEVAYSLAYDESLSAKERLEAMRTFDALSERRRILRMKPLPGSLKPELMGHPKPRAISNRKPSQSLAAIYAATQVQAQPLPDKPAET